MSMLSHVRGAIAWRAVQQGGVQIIYLLRLVILARLLVPEAFGQLAIATLIVTTLLSLSDVGVVPALVQRAQSSRDEEDAAWTIGILRAAAIALAVALTAPTLARWFGDSSSTPVIQVLALRPVLAALSSIGIVRLTREFRFREQAMIQVPAALMDLVVAVALASTFGVWALVVGTLAGALSASILSYVFAPHRPRLIFRISTTRPLIRFGRWVLGTSLVGLIASGGIQFVISRRLGVAELGLYFLATKVAFLPADAASSVVGSVAFPLYASIQRDDRQTREALRALLSLLGLVLFPTYMLMIALAPSFAEGLGPRWAGTASLIQLIGLAAAIGAYADAALPLLMGRGRPDRAMVVVATQTAVLLLVLLPLISAFGVVGAAAAWLPAYLAAQAISLWFVRDAIGHPLASSGRQLLAMLTVSVCAGFAAVLARVWLSGLAAFAGGLLLGILTGAVLLFGVSRHIHFDFRALMRAPAPMNGIAS